MMLRLFFIKTAFYYTSKLWLNQFFSRPVPYTIKRIKYCMILCKNKPPGIGGLF